ncbi:MAG: flagellar basal body rod protein FlgC [Anaerolineae bacterium]|nr:flagellar basal body rod protein FlgC [Anaerolineae bacterium]
MNGIFAAFRVTASALTAQRLRMDIISNNVANAETTRTEEGGPYQREQVVFVADQAETRFTLPENLPLKREIEPGQGVYVSEILADDTPGRQVYDPTHPDADEDGFVAYPNVNVVTEMTDMLSATRSYEANVTVFNSLKNMALKALEIGRG